MQIQGETTVYVARSGFVEGAIGAHANEINRVVLVLGSGLSVSLPVEYAQALIKDMQDAVIKCFDNKGPHAPTQSR